MEFFKTISRWFGRRQTRAGTSEIEPPRDLEPIEFSPSQREMIVARIPEFAAEYASKYPDAYPCEAFHRAKALPLYLDWSGYMGLSPDGNVFWFDYDEEDAIIESPVIDERLRNLGLYQGTKLHPDLGFLLPSKPKDAIECSHCRGTGLIFPPDLFPKPPNILCYCGGLGWLPPVRKP